MATEFTNHTATPVGLWDTENVYHVAPPLSGSIVLEPSESAQETIDILVAAGAGATIDAEPPKNTELPSITGTPTVGQVLTVTNGTWTGNPSPTFTQQWRRGATKIASATGATYTLVADDVGQSITCAVTATNSSGSDVAISNELGPVVVATEPKNVTPPAVTGEPELGELLTATAGEWGGSPLITYAYAWQRSADGVDDWEAIGATVATYTLVEDDEDQFVRCVVTATNAEGSESEPSNVIGPVVNPEG